MHKWKILILFVLLAVLAGLSAYGTTALGSMSAAAVDWFVFGGSGGNVALGTLTLDSSVGQTVVGEASLAGNQLCSGFLCQGIGRAVYLPLVERVIP
jgi:hypothetical protein